VLLFQNPTAYAIGIRFFPLLIYLTTLHKSNILYSVTVVSLWTTIFDVKHNNCELSQDTDLEFSRRDRGKP